MAKELLPDVFISVGGGSTHDTTKAMANPVGRRRRHPRLRNYLRASRPDYRAGTPSPKVPILSVPTTMGCAEFSRGGGGITDHQLGRKLILAGEGVTHHTVILDGQALATTPLRILVSTAIGQLRIAVETVYSTGHNPIGDGMALHAIRLLFDKPPPLQGWGHRHAFEYQDRLRVGFSGVLWRAGSEYGDLPSRGWAVRRSPRGGQRHPAAPYHALHLDASASRQRLIAEAIGVADGGMTDEAAGLAAADAVDGLCRELGLPRRLSDVDVPEDGLEFIAAATLHDRSLSTNPKPVTDAGPIMDVLRAAY